MEESFLISVVLDNIPYSFEAQLVAIGYTHQFHVTINNLMVIYEPDEERNYRAILAEPDRAKARDADIRLISAVGRKIQEA